MTTLLTCMFSKIFYCVKHVSLSMIMSSMLNAMYHNVQKNALLFIFL